MSGGKDKYLLLQVTCTKPNCEIPFRPSLPVLTEISWQPLYTYKRQKSSVSPLATTGNPGDANCTMGRFNNVAHGKYIQVTFRRHQSRLPGKPGWETESVITPTNLHLQYECEAMFHQEQVSGTFMSNVIRSFEIRGNP